MSGAERYSIKEAPFDHPLAPPLQRESSWDDAEVIDQPSSSTAGVSQTAQPASSPRMADVVVSALAHSEKPPSQGSTHAPMTDQLSNEDVEFCDPRPKDTASLWSKSMRGMKLFIMSRTGLFREHRFKEAEPAFLLGRKYCAKIPHESDAMSNASATVIDTRASISSCGSGTSQPYSGRPSFAASECAGINPVIVEDTPVPLSGSSTDLLFMKVSGAGKFLVTPPAPLMPKDPTASNVTTIQSQNLVAQSHTSVGAASGSIPLSAVAMPPPTPLTSSAKPIEEAPVGDLLLDGLTPSRADDAPINVNFMAPTLSSKLPPGSFKLFRETFDALIWMTYRKNFPSMHSPPAPPKTTSDTGWGCMLRSAQMLLANTLMTHCLSRKWTETVPCCPVTVENEDSTTGLDDIQRDTSVNESNQCSQQHTSHSRPTHPPLSYGKLLSLFIDHPSAPLSIHRLTEYGSAIFNRHAGEWYGPAQAATLLKFCVKAIPDEDIPNFCIVSMQGNTVYLDQIIQACSGEEVKNVDELQQWQVRAVQIERSARAHLRRHNARKERRKVIQAATPLARATDPQLEVDVLPEGAPGTAEVENSETPELADDGMDLHESSPAQQKLLSLISKHEDEHILSQLFASTEPEVTRMPTILPQPDGMADMIGHESKSDALTGFNPETASLRGTHEGSVARSDLSVKAIDDNDDEANERDKLDTDAFCKDEYQSDVEQDWQALPVRQKLSKTDRSASYLATLKEGAPTPSHIMSGDESDREDSSESDHERTVKAKPYRSIYSSTPSTAVTTGTDVEAKQSPTFGGVDSDAPKVVLDGQPSSGPNPAGSATQPNPSDDLVISAWKDENKYAKTALRWRSCLILVPIRAGVSDTIDPKHYSSILHLLQFPMSVGIMGGKPRSSLYFVGAQGTRLFYLDPHTTQEAVTGYNATPEGLVHTTTCGNPKHHHKGTANDTSVDQDHSDEETDHDVKDRGGGDSYRHAPIQSIELGAVDASMTAAFYCRTYADLCEFWRLLKRVEAEPHTVISGAEKSPSFDDFAGMTFDDDDNDDDESSTPETEIQRNGKSRVQKSVPNEHLPEQIASYAPVLPALHSSNASLSSTHPHTASDTSQCQTGTATHPGRYSAKRSASIVSPTDESDENSDIQSRLSSSADDPKLFVTQRQHATQAIESYVTESPDAKEVVALSSSAEVLGLDTLGTRVRMHTDSDLSFIRLSSDLASIVPTAESAGEAIRALLSQPTNEADSSSRQVAFSSRQPSSRRKSQRSQDSIEGDDEEDFVVI